MNARLFAGIFALALAAAVPAAAPDLPPAAHGTFVQRKTLADIGVTLVSHGVFRFVRGERFEWETRTPFPSRFCATPTNYAVTVAGRTTTHPLDVDVADVAGLFQIKEMKEFVRSVTPRPATGFPETVSVAFRNGDRLEIALTLEP